MWKAGMKASCVNGAPRKGRHWAGPRPIDGETYTVSRVFNGIDRANGGRATMLFLEELGDNNGWGYLASRFRPIVSRSTDTGMALLREIADRETIREPVLSPTNRNADVEGEA